MAIVATDADASEPGENGGIFTLTRTGDLSDPMTVTYEINGSATNGVDYHSIPSSVTIPATVASLNVPVTPKDDIEAEGDETVIITLTGPCVHAIGNTATVAIADDDMPVVSVTATADAAEAGATAGNFTVTRTGNAAKPVVSIVATASDAAEALQLPGTITVSRDASDTSAALTVHFSVSGTATSGDYTLTSGGLPLGNSIDIPAGQSSVAITVTPVDDALPEGDETATLTLSADDSYEVGAADSATVVIADDDMPVVTIEASTAIVGEAGPGGGVFTVTRSGSTADALVVKYAVGGSGTNGTDYSVLSARV